MDTEYQKKCDTSSLSYEVPERLLFAIQNEQSCEKEQYLAWKLSGKLLLRDALP